MLPLVLLLLAAQALSAQTEADVRRAAIQALQPMERSAAAFVSKRACVSCHHNILPIVALHLAGERGVPVDQTVLAGIERKTFQQLLEPKALDNAVQSATLNDPTPNDSFLLMAAQAAGRPKDLVTGVYARRLLGWQREGHWVTSDFRPPHSSSVFTATASAVRAIRSYLPEELRSQGDAAILRTRQWLVATRPASTEDAAFRLMGLVWSGGAPAEIETVRNDLLALQQANGGWPELPAYGPDAYSTGEALYALHESGFAARQSHWRKGLRFLLTTQASDGTWHVKTRMLSPAQVSPEYVATDFPYGQDEFISYAGTSWATLALLSALPKTAQATEMAHTVVADGPGWARTALFGTPQQLASLLDAGLDPNSRTSNGTTVLMMAAPDRSKIEVLLGRGADAKVRAASGCDALSAAGAYRDTAGSMRLLLEHGAEPNPPSGVRARCSALVFASMTGDLDAVTLLLAHGADPSKAAAGNTPLTAALTFGYPEVARTLISAGASASITEKTGINLLHWAVITNRAAVIPVLVQAGVPLNAIDENGYTPLMYAATIDFGDTAAAKALLEAGADRSVRNPEGRNPSEQAEFYHHAQLADTLR